MVEKTENSEETTLIKLEFDIGEIAFADEDELRDWAAEERRAYNWLSNSKDNNSQTVWRKINEWLTAINTFLQQCNQYHNNPNQIQHSATQLNNTIIQALRDGTLITSKSPPGQFVCGLSVERNPNIAACALGYLMNIGLQMDTNAVTGSFLAMQYLQGSVESVESIAKALEALLPKWEKKYQDQLEAIQQQVAEFKAQIADSTDRFTELSNCVDELHKEQAIDYDEFITESKKKQAALEHTYDQKLTLKSSVTYWSNKRDNHANLMKIFGGITLALAVGVGLAFGFTSYKLLQVTFKEVLLWELGVLIAISTFGIWLTRLSSKIFISNLHLKTDADERVTMMQTYLALLRDKNGLKEEDRELILATLFRPSTSGFINDDGPSNFNELILDSIKRR